ncbi:hypothetical protein D910_00104 [Dendroctonus ponderosae]|uniref:Fibrillar collagen NC1 domain-containing protein n=2 Tax=Dendroctonus ponderosae TaxID=77166 RepID=U4UNL2_DENPD|nr:hypothetical protein D910_00104 [Dendroctonus ponderosae]
MTDEGETCIYPDQYSASMPNIPWKRKGTVQKWFSEFEKGSKITYEGVGMAQMAFLRLSSEQGYQNFTYSCLNAVAWYDTSSHTYDMGIRLLGSSGQEFSYKGLRPEVRADECKARQGKSKTVFEIRTRQIDQLPLTDFLPIDYGESNQAFGFSVGPACFK